MATFHAVQIHDAKKITDKNALKIFGVRIAKFLPTGWVHFGEMTPSKTLLFKAKDLEKKGNWGKESFEREYLPFFLNEIKQNKKAKMEFNDILSHLESGRDVYYACYCGNVHICHRSIVAELIKRKGFAINLN